MALQGIVSRLLVALSLAAPTIALTPAQWRSQSIYQVMTDRFARTDLSTTSACDPSEQIYCGGTWQGLIDKLDYIQDMGFTAIWISPMVGQMSGNTSDGSSYHGYWAQDITTVNSAFGSSSDLIALSDALHGRGMYLMLDVVTNHFAFKGAGASVDYSIFVPFNSKSYFHDFCLIDYSNITSIQNCWQGSNTVSLPDLRTEDEDVYSVWYSWIADIVSKYGVDGIRLDSTQQLNYNFTPDFVEASGVYVMGEVFNGDPAYVTPYQQYVSGLLNYPAFFWITQAFQSTSGNITNLANGINTMKDEADDTTLYGSFLENHDNARFPSLTSDMSLAKTAIAFTMLMDGIPVVYEGQEQHYNGGNLPENREAVWLSGYDTSAELYSWITRLNAVRSWAASKDSEYLTYQASPVYSDSHTIALRKGSTGAQIVGVYSNVGASGNTTVKLSAAETGFTAGQALTDVMSCTGLTADSSGAINVAISGGAPRVFYPTAALSGASICGGGSTTTTATSKTASATLTATASGSGTASSSSKTASSSSKTATSSATATAGACTVSSVPVAITFDEDVETAYGTTIKISGDVAALGDWNTDDAVDMSASLYTSSDPLWDVVVDLTPESVVEYKYIMVDGAGDVVWESDPNHTLTVPCSEATVLASWQ